MCVDQAVVRSLGPMLRYLITGLVEQAIQVHLVSPDAVAETIALGPTQATLYAPIRWPFAQRRTQQLIESVASNPPTVVHALSGDNLRTAISLAQAFDADTICSVHSLADIDALLSLDHRLVSTCLPASEPLKARLAASGRWSPEAMTLIRPGILATPALDFPEQPNHRRTLISTDDFDEQSDLTSLIHAIQRVGRDSAPFTFLLGEGRQEDRLRNLVRTLRLSATITFAHPSGDVASAMSAGELFVDAGGGDQLSIHTLRALAAGMCIIAVDGGVADYLRDDETALLYSRGQVDRLAEIIRELMKNPTTSHPFARRAWEYVRTNHSVSVMAETTAGIYRRLSSAHATFPFQR